MRGVHFAEIRTSIIHAVMQNHPATIM